MATKPQADKQTHTFAWSQRQDLGETPQAHEAFLVYLHAGAGKRSLAKTRDIIARRDGKQVRSADGNLRTLETWSSKYHWTERVDAWDAWINQRRIAAAMSAREAQVKKEVAIITVATDIALMNMKRHRRELRKDRTLKHGIRDSRELARDLITLARVGRGEATDISATVNIDDVTAKLERRIRQMVANRKRLDVPSPQTSAPAADDPSKVTH